MSQASRAWLLTVLGPVFDLHVRLPSGGRQAQQPDQPGLPLDQRADRRARVLADDEVALPVPRPGSGRRAGRAAGGS